MVVDSLTNDVLFGPEYPDPVGNSDLAFSLDGGIGVYGSIDILNRLNRTVQQWRDLLHPRLRDFWFKACLSPIPIGAGSDPDGLEWRIPATDKGYLQAIWLC